MLACSAAHLRRAALTFDRYFFEFLSFFAATACAVAACISGALVKSNLVVHLDERGGSLIFPTHPLLDGFRLCESAHIVRGFLCVRSGRGEARAASIARVSRLCKSMLARAFVVLFGIETLAAVCAGSIQRSCMPRLELVPIASRLAGSLGSAAKESSVLAVHACLLRSTLATCSAYARLVIL